VLRRPKSLIFRLLFGKMTKIDSQVPAGFTDTLLLSNFFEFFWNFFGIFLEFFWDLSGIFVEHFTVEGAHCHETHQ
jgi:hypothetical protein